MAINGGPGMLIYTIMYKYHKDGYLYREWMLPGTKIEHPAIRRYWHYYFRQRSRSSSDTEVRRMNVQEPTDTAVKGT
jgi:hypothetical protein